MLFHAAVSFVLAGLAAARPHDGALDSRDSSAGKCRRVTLGGAGKIGMTTLQGECADSAGQWWNTSLNLNHCIGNDAGKLAYQDEGNFDKACRPCIIEVSADMADVDLKCNCLKPNGVPQFTLLRMGEHAEGELAVKVVDGVFACGPHKGTGSRLEG